MPADHVDQDHAPRLASLVCPETGRHLTLVERADAERAVCAPLVPRDLVPNTRGDIPAPIGVTDLVLLRDDLGAAYPVVDGIPVLLVPEVLTPSHAPRVFDLTQPPYAEAYEEHGVYDAMARADAADVQASPSFGSIRVLLDLDGPGRARFPHPRRLTVDATFDGAAQWDALMALGSPAGRTILQIGGKGLHAVKCLLGGAASAWLLTPVVGEAVYALAIAQAAGVGDRLSVVVGVAEEMPFSAETFDGAYAGGCLHHTETRAAFAEAARVLRPGACFAAVDPWRAPGYGIGTRLLGKREADVYCRPLDSQRMAPIDESFGTHALVHHGTFTRYLLLTLAKVGVKATPAVAWRIMALDDRVSSLLRLRGLGSSVSVVGWK